LTPAPCQSEGTVHHKRRGEEGVEKKSNKSKTTARAGDRIGGGKCGLGPSRTGTVISQTKAEADLGQRRDLRFTSVGPKEEMGKESQKIAMGFPGFVVLKRKTYRRDRLTNGNLP